MKEISVLKKLLALGVVLTIASYIASYFNIGININGLESFNFNSFAYILLWSVLFIIKIGTCISILLIFMRFKKFDVLTITPCILILDIANMLIEGCNLLILISSIYFTIVIFFVIKLKMLK